MSFMNSLFATSTSTLSLSSPDHWLTNIGGKTHAGTAVTEHTALTLTAVYRAVATIADAVAQLPLDVFRKKGTLREEVQDHPVVRILRAPNPLMASMVLRNTTQGHVLLWGNGYLEVQRTEGGSPIALWPLLPDRTVVEPDNKGGFRYRTNISGKTLPLDTKDVIHIPALGFDGLRGYSPIWMARHAVGLGLALEEFGSKFFSNDAKSGGFLEHPGKLSEVAQKRITEAMDRKGGLDNAHRLKILEEGMKFHQTTIPPEDAQFLMTRQFQVEEIARLFGVPLHMLQSQAKSTCLPAGALVLTVNGPVPVERVAEGDTVWGFDGKRFKRSRVFRSEMTGIQPLVTIATRTNTLKCTANHKVIVRRRFKSPGEKNSPVEWRNVWVRADEVTTADYMLGAHGLTAQRKRTAPNGRKLTEHFMEFCGLYVAEGCMSTDKKYNSGGIVRIARHIKAPYIDSYKKAIRSEFVSLRDGQKRPPVPVHIQERERDMAFNSTSAVRDLRELGFAGTAHTKRIPGWVFDCERPLQLAFLRGYLDGDGHVNRKGWITWSSCHKELVEDVRHLCMIVGVPCGSVRHYEYSGEVVINGRVSQRGDMYQAWCYSPAHNAEIGSHDPRYTERWSKAGKSTRVGPYSDGFEGRGPSKTTKPGVGFEAAGAVLLKVHSVERGSVCVPVYDLGVEGAHTFIADGLVVHNSWGSGIAQMSLGFVTYTIGPWLSRWEQELDRKLLTDAERNDGYYIKHNVNALLRADPQTRAEYYKKARDPSTGWMTREEVRALEDLSPESDTATQEVVDVIPSA